MRNETIGMESICDMGSMFGGGRIAVWVADTGSSQNVQYGNSEAAILSAGDCFSNCLDDFVCTYGNWSCPYLFISGIQYTFTKFAVVFLAVDR